MKSCIYAGSFDPVTFGHIDVIERALKIFDEVFVAVGENESKTPFIPAKERVFLIEKLFEKDDRIKVLSYNCLTVDLCKRLNVKVLLRGIRGERDFAYEKELERINKTLSKDIETVYIFTDEKLSHISSSAAREIYRFGGDLKSFVPSFVEEYLTKRKRER